MALEARTNVTGTFKVNKYDDIDGARVSQKTERGRLCFRDSDGRMTLPRTLAEAKKALFPVDWAKPLNPGPYYLGAGLNGEQIYSINDGSFNEQESAFLLDEDQGYSTPWPAAIITYEIYPALYNLPVVSGNKALVYDGGTFTFTSGAFTGIINDFHKGQVVYTDYSTGNEGKLTVSGVAAGNTVVGQVVDMDVFGANTITVKLRGSEAITS
jgi:hypothetical protein